MESDERRKIDRALEIAEENNKMLKKLYRGMQWGRIFRVVYWIVIIGVAVGAFYFIQPYINQFADVYEGFKGSVERIQGYFGGNGEAPSAPEME